MEHLPVRQCVVLCGQVQLHQSVSRHRHMQRSGRRSCACVCSWRNRGGSQWSAQASCSARRWKVPMTSGSMRLWSPNAWVPKRISAMMFNQVCSAVSKLSAVEFWGDACVWTLCMVLCAMTYVLMQGSSICIVSHQSAGYPETSCLQHLCAASCTLTLATLTVRTMAHQQTCSKLQQLSSVQAVCAWRPSMQLS